MNKTHILFALQENCCGCCCFEKIFGKISSSDALTPKETGGSGGGEAATQNSEYLCQARGAGDTQSCSPGGRQARSLQQCTPQKTFPCHPEL